MKKIKKILIKIKNPRNFKLLLGIAITVICIVGYIYLTITSGRIIIENSLIQAPVSKISPLSPGKLVEMEVYEGQEVRKGDALAVVGSDTIRADTDGLIIATNKEIGGITSAQNPLVQLINLSDMRVVGTIDENKGLNKIKVGQVVSFTIDALPGKTFWGYIDHVGQTAKQTQLSFSISSERPVQQFEVYAKFDAHVYPEIKNGMSAKMTVFTNTP